YVAQVIQDVPDGGELRGEAGWVTPYPAEYRESGADLALLTRVAAAGGGRLLAAPAEVVAPVARPAQARHPLAPRLLVLAARARPLELAARRLVLPPRALRLPREASAVRAVAPPPGPARPSGAAALATGTTSRLLDRKRVFRARRRV